MRGCGTWASPEPAAGRRLHRGGSGASAAAWRRRHFVRQPPGCAGCGRGPALGAVVPPLRHRPAVFKKRFLGIKVNMTISGMLYAEPYHTTALVISSVMTTHVPEAGPPLPPRRTQEHGAALRSHSSAWKRSMQWAYQKRRQSCASVPHG